MTTPQLPLGIQARQSYFLEDFIAGENRELLQRLTAFATSDETAFMFVSGEAGQGRSHLLQAACNAVNSEQRDAIYLPLAQHADASPTDFTSIAKPLLLALDDVHLVAGNREWEQALVGAFDAVRFAGGRILASGNASPKNLGLLLPDLMSRLAWGEVHHIHPLDDDDKIRLLQQQGGASGLVIADDVARYLLSRVSRDMPTVLGWLARLDKESLAAKRRLTIPFVREVMSREVVQT